MKIRLGIPRENEKAYSINQFSIVLYKHALGMREERRGLENSSGHYGINVHVLVD